MNAVLRSSLRVSARHRVTYYMGVESALPGQGAPGSTTANVVVPKGLWEYRPHRGR